MCVVVAVPMLFMREYAVNTVKRPARWKDEYYLRCYEMAKEGMKNGTIARTLGVSLDVFEGWIRKLPALTEALEKGRGRDRNGVEVFQDYVFGRLPERLKGFWKDMQRN